MWLALTDFHKSLENLPERDGQDDGLGVLCARGLGKLDGRVVARVLTAANRNFEMEQKVKRCGV